jgi:hypothetical protein
VPAFTCNNTIETPKKDMFLCTGRLRVRVLLRLSRHRWYSTSTLQASSEPLDVAQIEYWRKIPVWQDTTETEFLDYKWQVWILKPFTDYVYSDLTEP